MTGVTADSERCPADSPPVRSPPVGTFLPSGSCRRPYRSAAGRSSKTAWARSVKRGSGADPRVMRGRDTVVVMPTGSGKSLITSPAAPAGLTVVVSPHRALRTEARSRRTASAVSDLHSKPHREQAAKPPPVEDGEERSSTHYGEIQGPRIFERMRTRTVASSHR